MREKDGHYRRGEHPKNMRPPEAEDELPGFDQVVKAIEDYKARRATGEQEEN